MTPTADLADGGKSLWADRLEEFLRICHMPHKELESVTGRLPYSETSVFGRFGRGMLQPLYRKLNAAYYQLDLPDSDRTGLQWWEDRLREAKF